MIPMSMASTFILEALQNKEKCKRAHKKCLEIKMGNFSGGLRAGNIPSHVLLNDGTWGELAPPAIADIQDSVSLDRGVDIGDGSDLSDEIIAVMDDVTPRFYTQTTIYALFANASPFGVRHPVSRTPFTEEQVSRIRQFFHTYGTLNERIMGSMRGRGDIIMELVEKGLEINESGVNLAVTRGDLNALRLFLQLNDSNIVPSNNSAHIAAENGYLEVLQLLYYDWGIVPSRYSANLAAKNGHLEVLRQLYAWDIVPSSYGAHLAAENGHMEVLTTLHNWGINPSGIAANAAAANGNAEILQKLHDWDINVVSSGFYNLAIETAVKRGHIEVLRKLFDWGYLNYDVASIAAANGQPEVAEQLRQWTAERHRQPEVPEQPRQWIERKRRRHN